MLVRSEPSLSEGRVAVLPPLPPAELRRLVCHDDALFELNPQSPLIFPYVSDPTQYRTVFDFGCGCGRIARQLMVQNPPPERYVGIDINRGMIAWCQRHLTEFDRAFQFHHHDVWNLGLGPDNTRQPTAPFPVGSSEFSLVIAHSVFTHLYKDQTEFYLAEIARILTDEGVARTTWFLFDRTTFPMMFDFQVSLFINETDPSNAVIYDWRWLLNVMDAKGLRVTHTVPALLRGHQWELYLEKARAGRPHSFPHDGPAHSMMCGSGANGAKDVSRMYEEPATEATPEENLQPAAVPEPAPEPGGILIPPPRPRHVLRYTGELSRTEFEARCAELPWWYHSYYFDNGFSVRGDYDIGADVANYGFPESLEGLRVLDIGTGAGWFALYFEHAGAEVTTVDARGYSDFDVYGRPSYPPFEKEGRSPDRIEPDGTPVYFSPVSRGFWIMKDMLRSQVKFRNARVYDINPAMFNGQKFDLVFMGAILCHLRDPIGALMAARSVCRHRVIASTPVVLGETEPDILPRQYLPYTNVDKISWWLPNEACFRHWFLAAGFTAVDVSRQVVLRCDVPREEGGRAANGDQILRVGSAFVP
jgi:SAM-dependent methyltransferase